MTIIKTGTLFRFYEEYTDVFTPQYQDVGGCYMALTDLNVGLLIRLFQEERQADGVTEEQDYLHFPDWLIKKNLVRPLKITSYRLAKSYEFSLEGGNE